MLINGAAGGVGTFSVQIAKSFDTEVTGVCSSRNLELVRSIGADKVVDYTKEDFTRNGQTYDLILDNVGNLSVSGPHAYIEPHWDVRHSRIYLDQAYADAVHSWHQRVSKATGRKILSASSEKPNTENIQFLKGLLESRKVVPTIDRQYSLEQLAEAIGYVETGHARAKVVITM